MNVVDLMRLQDETEHPHGMPHADYDNLFGTDVPVIFAYHGYPWLIHRLTYRRANNHHLHVRGYKEEGTTTTPFDMVMMNDMDRYHLVMDVIDRTPSLGSRAASLRQEMVDTRRRARQWTRDHGDDLPEVRGLGVDVGGREPGARELAVGHRGRDDQRGLLSRSQAEHLDDLSGDRRAPRWSGPPARRPGSCRSRSGAPRRRSSLRASSRTMPSASSPRRAARAHPRRCARRRPR